MGIFITKEFDNLATVMGSCSFSLACDFLYLGWYMVTTRWVPIQPYFMFQIVFGIFFKKFIEVIWDCLYLYTSKHSLFFYPFWHIVCIQQKHSLYFFIHFGTLFVSNIIKCVQVHRLRISQFPSSISLAFFINYMRMY